MVTLGTASVLRADARRLPLADDTVDLVVTSPPYFALRSYQDGGEHYAGQIGDEPTPAEFVESLLEVTRECMRVLKPSGSLWVNLGDKYSGAQAQNFGGVSRAGASADVWKRTDPKRTGIPRKSLMGIPWRYALRCIDDLALILRAEVIWAKPNGLPESVTDRVRRSHEQWFHFTLSPRYFSAVDEIREAQDPRNARPNAANREGVEGEVHRFGATSGMRNGENRQHPLGKLPGSVWTVPTEPLRVPDHLGVDHYAAFPSEWPKRIISAWAPGGVCVECGEGRRPVSRVERDGDCSARRASDRGFGVAQGDNRNAGIFTITGYVCDCEEPTAPTTPAVVLDPFGGTGTTAMVAKALGRHGISVDLSADYCRIAEWRTNDRDQLARVLGVAKAPPVAADEVALFDMDGGAV